MLLVTTVYVLLFLLTRVVTGQLTNDQTDFATKVAVCRAHCIDGFAHRFVTMTNYQCESESDCFMCWENCEMFYRNFNIWGSICEDSVVCFDGCQLACAVYKTKLTFKADPWSFPEGKYPTVDRNVSSGYFKLEWPQPLPIYPVVPPLPHLIYVIFWRTSNGWIQINQTVTKYFFTKNPDIVTDNSIHLLIMAVTRDGIVNQLMYSANLQGEGGQLRSTVNSNNAFLHSSTYRWETGNDNNKRINFIVIIVASVVTSCLLLIVGTFYGRKIIKEQRRKYLLRRTNALKLKRSRRSFGNESNNSPHGSRSNLLRIETVSKPFNEKLLTLDPPPIFYKNSNNLHLSNLSHDDKDFNVNHTAVIKVDSNVPFVLSITENAEGIEEVRINAVALKQKLDEQKSVLV